MKITTIEAGFFHVDGGAMFGVVPKRVWQKRYPCNDQNFCRLAMRLLLIETNNRLILIDSGAGKKQLEYLKYYDFTEIVDFGEALKQHGYTCEQVTDVVMTHLHFDHCGGTTSFVDENKTVGLTFPNALVWVGRVQWENFLQPNVREGDSYFTENMLPVLQAGKLQLVDKEIKIDDRVMLKLFHGHTVGQLVPYISYDDENTLVYVGDVIPVVASIPIAWVSAYDTFPITSMEDKERLLNEAAEKRQLLFFEHDAYFESCRIEIINGKYRATEQGKVADLLIKK
ncbi:MBL fold metallo-hydrolase [Microbacter margulisiae]|uniref:Glyoxylase-like metal-dependent hydrolase (Beta-lactamase superfamily II) n=1 Tax=Microbacter margulisiae TaxID=1350067 RepID=A0A7W5H3R6_9PORP|nr:MBL fold metallo-hydrolase [Microbacter margulisiae]MBB3188627.1 glyoxylase-like metal-dependent hydrolase (beta-lactamase superfamily II) [Microbacter margulisiae]